MVKIYCSLFDIGALILVPNVSILLILNVITIT